MAVWYGYTNVTVGRADFEVRRLGLFETGVEHDELVVEWNSPGVAYVPDAASAAGSYERCGRPHLPYLHLWFVTLNDNVLYSWRPIPWLDLSGMWI
jgi:hypothetical protein